MKIIMSLLIIFILITACGEKVTENNSTNITDMEWQLEKLNDTSISELSLEKIPTLTFNTEDSKLNGFAGCNNFFGNYKIVENELEFGPMGATMMACPNLDLESEFLKTLESCNNFKSDGNYLILSQGDVEKIRFSKK